MAGRGQGERLKAEYGATRYCHRFLSNEIGWEACRCGYEHELAGDEYEFILNKDPEFAHPSIVKNAPPPTIPKVKTLLPPPGTFTKLLEGNSKPSEPKRLVNIPVATTTTTTAMTKTEDTQMARSSNGEKKHNVDDIVRDFSSYILEHPELQVGSREELQAIFREWENDHADQYGLSFAKVLYQMARFLNMLDVRNREELLWKTRASDKKGLNGINGSNRQQQQKVGTTTTGDNNNNNNSNNTENLSALLLQSEREKLEAFKTIQFLNKQVQEDQLNRKLNFFGEEAFCDACGGINLKGFRFCSTCGVEHNDCNCNACGAINLPRFKFCSTCGTPSKTVTPTTTRLTDSRSFGESTQLSNSNVVISPPNERLIIAPPAKLEGFFSEPPFRGLGVLQDMDDTMMLDATIPPFGLSFHNGTIGRNK